MGRLPAVELSAVLSAFSYGDAIARGRRPAAEHARGSYHPALAAESTAGTGVAMGHLVLLEL